MIINRNKTINEPLTPGRLRQGAVAALAGSLFLLAFQASAAPYAFSTGNPDGKVATLSRASSPGKIQTETADDFFVVSNSTATLIQQAMFTGLIPAGTPLSSVQNVEVEIYHVFPGDSNTNRTIHVPTRQNSPGDVEIDDATRDSAEGSLSFSVSLVSASFTASNSVVNGIHPATNQTTFGEGPVTGEEVSIIATFNPPISLPPGHYFFRPEVLLSSGDFLWLSAPRPIVGGTPFPPGTTDLQSWIRNDDLAPDWLRIGADIIGAGAFNASFSLLGETDEDNDGVADSVDQCAGTPAGAIVSADGCSIDQLAPCSGPTSGGSWKNHGQYVSAVSQAAEAFLEQGLISAVQADAIVSQAAQSSCGSK